MDVWSLNPEWFSCAGWRPLQSGGGGGGDELTLPEGLCS
jgi:hypothetical protein